MARAWHDSTRRPQIDQDRRRPTIAVLGTIRSPRGKSHRPGRSRIKHRRPLSDLARCLGSDPYRRRPSRLGVRAVSFFFGIAPTTRTRARSAGSSSRSRSCRPGHHLLVHDHHARRRQRPAAVLNPAKTTRSSFMCENGHSTGPLVGRPVNGKTKPLKEPGGTRARAQVAGLEDSRRRRQAALIS